MKIFDLVMGLVVTTGVFVASSQAVFAEDQTEFTSGPGWNLQDKTYELNCEKVSGPAYYFQPNAKKISFVKATDTTPRDRQPLGGMDSLEVHWPYGANATEGVILVNLFYFDRSNGHLYTDEGDRFVQRDEGDFSYYSYALKGHGSDDRDVKISISLTFYRKLGQFIKYNERIVSQANSLSRQRIEAEFSSCRP